MYAETAQLVVLMLTSVQTVVRPSLTVLNTAPRLEATVLDMALQQRRGVLPMDRFLLLVVLLEVVSKHLDIILYIKTLEQIMSDKFKNNPNIVFREEFDDWAVLFDPDTGKTCCLSPTGVFIWKQLDGTRSKDDILKALSTVCEEGLPEEAADDYDKFIEQLLDSDLVAI